MATLREKELSGSTPLSDCPEVLKFYKQPQVQRFEEKYFGYGPDDNVWFRGGCPSLETVQKSYAEAQQRVAQGLVK